MEGFDVIDVDADDDVVMIRRAFGLLHGKQSRDLEVVVVDDSSDEDVPDVAIHNVAVVEMAEEEKEEEEDEEKVVEEEEEWKVGETETERKSPNEEVELEKLVLHEFSLLIKAALWKLESSLQVLRALASTESPGSEYQDLGLADEMVMDNDLDVLLNILFEIWELNPALFTHDSIKNMDFIMQLLPHSKQHPKEKTVDGNKDGMMSDGIVSKDGGYQLPSEAASTEIFPMKPNSPVRGSSGLAKCKAAADDKHHTEKIQKDEISNATLLSNPCVKALLNSCAEAPLNHCKSVGVQKKVPCATASTGIFATKQISPDRKPSGLTKRKAAAADMSNFKDHAKKIQKNEISKATCAEAPLNPCVEALLNHDKCVGVQKQVPCATASTEIFPTKRIFPAKRPSVLTKRNAAAAEMSEFKDAKKIHKDEINNSTRVEAQLNPCVDAPLNHNRSVGILKQVPCATTSTEIFPAKQIYVARGPSGLTKCKATTTEMSEFKDHPKKIRKDEINIATSVEEAPLIHGKSVGIHKQVPATASMKISPTKKNSLGRGPSGLTKRKGATAATSDFKNYTKKIQKDEIRNASHSKSVGVQKQGNIDSRVKMLDQKIITSNGLNGIVEQNSLKNMGPAQRRFNDPCHSFPNVVAQNSSILGFEPGKSKGNKQLDSLSRITCPAVENTEPTSGNMFNSSDKDRQGLENADKIPTIKDSDLSNVAACTNNRECSSSLTAPREDSGHLRRHDNIHEISMEKELMKRRVKQVKLFAVKKLSLVLDLDHTLLNSAMFTDVEPSYELKLRIMEENDRGNPKYYPFRLQHMKMWTKLRPGVGNFLEKASKLYELHIDTMGTMAYAAEMVKVLDPTGDLFGGRVVARGEAATCLSTYERGPPRNKDLNDILGMESAVVIIDDTVDVWPHHKDNLINLERYIYFPCSRRNFRSMKQSLLECERDESTSYGTLATLLVVIERIHREFFSHSKLFEADVRKILVSMQQKVLAGCRILFSGIIPVEERNPHHHPIWRTAVDFGASCTNHSDVQVTHVVAKFQGTEKVIWAHKNKKFVVNTAWIEASAFQYRRAEESQFPLTT